MFERFTERARQVVILAQEEARNLKHEYIGTEHLLLGLLRVDDGIGARVLANCDVTEAHVRALVIEEVGEGQETLSGQIPFTPRCKQVCEYALREALSLGHNYIGTEHLLLALMREDEGLAAQILAGAEVHPQRVRDETIDLLNSTGGNPERWAEYLICKQRGHVAGEPVLATERPKTRCTYCKTVFWTETVVRESNAPSEPKAQAA